jgi:hypothetical protein
MRAILAASAAIFIASTAPSMANDHAWCARTLANGHSAFTSYRQCVAALSAQRARRISDPRLSYAQMEGWRRNAEAHDYDFWHDRPYGWDFWH